jgi:4-aminobutyrate aminotransferase-like enzyme
MGSFDDVSTGSTWSWLPAACAATIATIELFEREPILEGVRTLEEAALASLLPLLDRYQRVGDVRVTGCFIAIEFVKDRTTKDRDPELMHRVAEGCIRRGLLGDASTTSFNLQPSLVMPPELMERAAAIVDEAIAEAIGTTA